MKEDCCKSTRIVHDGKEYVCSLAFTLQLIADKYKSLILFHLKDGKKRSGELQSTIHGISNRMFSHSIRGLERDGLVNRIVYPEVPPRVEYELSSAGESIIPILLNLDEWGKNFAEKNNLYTSL